MAKENEGGATTSDASNTPQSAADNSLDGHTMTVDDILGGSDDDGGQPAEDEADDTIETGLSDEGVDNDDDLEEDEDEEDTDNGDDRRERGSDDDGDNAKDDDGLSDEVPDGEDDEDDEDEEEAEEDGSGEPTNAEFIDDAIDDLVKSGADSAEADRKKKGLLKRYSRLEGDNRALQTRLTEFEEANNGFKAMQDALLNKDDAEAARAKLNEVIGNVVKHHGWEDFVFGSEAPSSSPDAKSAEAGGDDEEAYVASLTEDEREEYDELPEHERKRELRAWRAAKRSVKATGDGLSDEDREALAAVRKERQSMSENQAFVAKVNGEVKATNSRLRREFSGFAVSPKMLGEAMKAKPNYDGYDAVVAVYGKQIAQHVARQASGKSEIPPMPRANKTKNSRRRAEALLLTGDTHISVDDV